MEEIRFLVEFCQSVLNDPLDSYLPEITLDSKMYFRMISRNHDYLNTSYYQSEVSLPFQLRLHYSLPWFTFAKEMYVRSILDTDFPEVYPIFSRAGWKGTDGSSFGLSPARMHRIAKYMLPDYLENIEKYIEVITMRKQSPPSYIRRMTRLTEFIPDLFKRFIPND